VRDIVARSVMITAPLSALDLADSMYEARLAVVELVSVASSSAASRRERRAR
jgi:hypothetical protein